MTTVRRLIEDRLREQVPGFKEVKGAASYMAVEENKLLADSVYVVRLIAKPGRNPVVMGVSQQVETTFGLYVVTKNVRDARGADSADANEAWCELIQQALLGWAPTDAGDVLLYAGGQLVEQKGALFIWREMYTLTHNIHS